MALKKIILNLFLTFLMFCYFAGCNEEKRASKEDNKTSENNATGILKQKTKEENLQETPLQKQLKKNLKNHLDELSQKLQEKNLNQLQLEQNTGIQKHIEYFESLHGRKDIPKNSSHENLNQKIQKAYEFQEERIENLRQKNDEMSK